MVEAILEHCKLTAMMSCVIRTGHFFVSVHLIPLVTLLGIPIIIKMEAVVHVLGILWHALHQKTK